MYSLFTNRKWRRIYLLYWAGYLLIFSVIQGVPSNDFFTAFRNELISIIPKIVFVTIVVEWLMDDLFLNKKVVRFILVYVLLLIAFAFVLRLVDNYIIIRYFLTYWKKETLLSAPPFLYNAIKLQFLVTIPFIVKLFIYQGSQKKQEKENDGAFLNLKCDRRVVKLMLADVSYFEAQGNYIFVYTAGQY